MTGITTEACMLNASAVDGQPCASASKAIVWPRRPTPAPPRRQIQLEEAFLAQPPIILDRVRGVAIMLG
jgi:hypothetical protein